MGEGNRSWNFLGMTFEPDALPRNESQINKSFLVLFSKKNKKKRFFLKKEAKTLGLSQIRQGSRMVKCM